MISVNAVQKMYGPNMAVSTHPGHNDSSGTLACARKGTMRDVKVDWGTIVNNVEANEM